MKFALVLLCTVVVAVLGERCSVTSDCKLTACADNAHHLACVNHECTCTSGSTGQTCTTADQCSGTNCRRGRPHCVDGECHCIGG